jgi:predicted O-methyltransferase YrrM
MKNPPVNFEKVHNYLFSATPRRDATLTAMERYAAKNNFPIIGPLVGRFLFQMATILGAKSVFELGSGYGYSAYWFSLAMGAKGSIILTEGDAKNLAFAQKYFRRGGLKSKFEFHCGDAREIIKEHRGPFDIVLNDIDKEGYPETIDLVAPRLRRGGLFITDNAIWDGRVTAARPDKTTRAIMEFNRRMYADKRFFTTILPLRDGLTVGLRL